MIRRTGEPAESSNALSWAGNPRLINLTIVCRKRGLIPQPDSAHRCWQSCRSERTLCNGIPVCGHHESHLNTQFAMRDFQQFGRSRRERDFNCILIDLLEDLRHRLEAVEFGHVRLAVTSE